MSYVSDSPSSDDRWRGTSSDERTDERRERLLAAGHAIVGTQGASALAVRGVCRAANVSPRHFYECFPDTDSLLLATYERAVQQLLASVGAALTGMDGPFEERLRAVFDAAAGYLEAHPESGRIIFREALTNDILRTRGVITLPAFLGAVRTMAAEPGRAPVPAPYRHLEATLLSGGLAAVFVEWLSGSGRFTRDELVSYCTTASLTLMSTAPTE